MAINGDKYFSGNIMHFYFLFYIVILNISRIQFVDIIQVYRNEFERIFISLNINSGSAF